MDVCSVWPPPGFGNQCSVCTDNVAIFDTGTTNILEFAGRLFPIDILPVRPDGTLLERILEALKIPFWSR